MEQVATPTKARACGMATGYSQNPMAMSTRFAQGGFAAFGQQNQSKEGSNGQTVCFYIEYKYDDGSVACLKIRGPRVSTSEGVCHASPKSSYNHSIEIQPDPENEDHKHFSDIIVGIEAKLPSLIEKYKETISSDFRSGGNDPDEDIKKLTSRMVLKLYIDPYEGYQCIKMSGTELESRVRSFSSQTPSWSGGALFSTDRLNSLCAYGVAAWDSSPSMNSGQALCAPY